MCVEATTHQKPSFKRVILFGTRGRKGYQSSSPSWTGGATENARIPYLLNNQRRTEIQAAPRAYCQPTPSLVTSSMYTLCVHYVQPICISLGSRENLIANGGTRRTVAASTLLKPPLPPPLLFHRYAPSVILTFEVRAKIFFFLWERGKVVRWWILAKLRSCHYCLDILTLV